MRYFLTAIVVIAVVAIVGVIAYGPSGGADSELELVATTTEPQVVDVEGPPPAIVLATTTVSFADGGEATFRLSEPYSLAVAAEGLGKVRFMVMSPDGRLFVPDIVDYKLSHEGKLYVLEDFDEETRRFKTVHTYLSGLRGANSVAFYKDTEGKTWLYLALTAHLIRYPYQAGDTAPSGVGEIVFEFPNTIAPEAKSVVWHITRTVKVRGDRLYLSIGSGCDACEQPEGEVRGMIASIRPDGSDLRVHAEGLRNAVDFTWADDALFATDNGVDHLGASAPDEKMHRIEDGGHYGWPYCYESDGVVQADDTFTWDRDFPCGDVSPAFAAFPPRSAPLGVEYFDRAHPVLASTFLVALHGSFDPGMQSGYEIVRVDREGNTETFMDGFQDEGGTRHARAVDFLPYEERSFFFTDDFGGRIYYVWAR